MKRIELEDMARFAVKSKGKENFLQLLDVCNCSLYSCYQMLNFGVVWLIFVNIFGVVDVSI